MIGGESEVRRHVETIDHQRRMVSGALPCFHSNHSSGGSGASIGSSRFKASSRTFASITLPHQIQSRREVGTILGRGS